ncbi:ribonucleases P/MRP protein subunit POP1-like [Xenia sp. Carnegie-2017]|uniref:ribonucleases P/MRP protein subunit POP1-like n=1 Tax=Xenia sp. Carnegie-2017 TaxID=2897299 RepID=UPI001F040581|nr:ribonucleases P/MRP protein subunit POP1-like [Xenia sp. Carnegie-2017]
MTQALSMAAKQSNKRVFQSLPRHMRRRAASHNPKRLPVRLREAHNREVSKSQEKQKEPLKQKKSRRHRRKVGNLLKEYIRRQKKHVWLETHVWHAKRFKMMEKWGYKIPLHPNDKSVRASYRAMAYGCLLQDISYYQCIEIEGRENLMLAAMKHLTNNEVGLTMAAADYRTGQYEGRTILYRCDKYPNHVIGPVMFLWQQTLDRESSRKLWVWSHPSCADEVAQEIQQACSIEASTEFINTKPWQCKDEGSISEESSTKITANENNESEAEKKVKSTPLSGNVKDKNQTEEGRNRMDNEKTNTSFNHNEKKEGLTVTVIHEELVRFRLTGPKSYTLLAATLELCNWRVKQVGSRWWDRYIEDKDRIKIIVEQNKNWEQMKGLMSPGMFKAGTVMALIVKDPRFGLPVRKSSIDMASEDIYNNRTSTDIVIPDSSPSPFSPLWNSEIRKDVKKSKIPEKDLNKLRSQQRVPGTKLDLGYDTPRIPVLIIQQPGNEENLQNSSLYFGSGCDIVLPASWSMAFWIALVYRGARVGGARELLTCSREKGVPHFPCDFPDTNAGFQHNEELKRSEEDQFKRHPPAKRPNYDKLGITSPFGPDWNTLVAEWCGEVERLVVLIKNMIESNNFTLKTETADSEKTIHTDTGESSESKICRKDNTEHHCTTRDSLSGNEDNNKTENTKENVIESDIHFNVLRSLSIRRCLRDITGSLSPGNLSSCKKRRGGTKSKHDILKFLLNNVSLNSRCLIHLHVRPLMKGSPQNNAILFLPTADDLMKLQQDKSYGGPVEHVHKTSQSSTVIGQSSRKTVGWITSGQFSFTRGQGSAIGLCTFPAFSELVVRTLRMKTGLLLLVRNSNTFQYRFASVIVV